MFDQCNHSIGPKLGVFEGDIEMVVDQELDHRDKGGAFVALLERMRLGDTGKKPNGENDQIVLTVGKGVVGTCKCAFEQPLIPQEMLLARYRNQAPVNFDGCIYEQPDRLTWQERLGSSETER